MPKTFSILIRIKPKIYQSNTIKKRIFSKNNIILTKINQKKKNLNQRGWKGALKLRFIIKNVNKNTKNYNILALIGSLSRNKAVIAKEN